VTVADQQTYYSNTIRRPEHRYGSSFWYRTLAPHFSFNQPSSQTQLWIGESASHAGGGTPTVSNRYASLYYYMDSLGATAAANHSGFLRQDLTGASYGLVEGCAMEGKWESYNLNVSKSRTPRGTCSPNPDYFGALLFTRLMGPRVMNVSTEGSSTVRAWGHCSAAAAAAAAAAAIGGSASDAGGSSGSGGNLTLLLLNLLNTTTTVDLSQAAVGATSRSDYILTPSSATVAVSEPGELLKSDVVDLNGQALLMNGDELPAVDGVEVTGAAGVMTLKLPPLAVGFAVVHGATVC
jgi:heparanase 1